MSGLNDPGRNVRPAVPADGRSPGRGAYVAPRLTVLGDIRSLTMGASAGVTDSGGLTEQPLGPQYPPTPGPGYDGEWPSGGSEQP